MVGLLLNMLGRSRLLTVIKENFILGVVGALNLPLSRKLKYFIGISEIRTPISTLMDELLVVQISTLRQYFRYYSAHTEVFITSPGHLKNVTTSYDQTRRLHDVWQKTSDLRRLVPFITSWRCLIYDVWKTSDLRCIEEVQFTTSWKRLICDV